MRDGGRERGTACLKETATCIHRIDVLLRCQQCLSHESLLTHSLSRLSSHGVLISDHWLLQPSLQLYDLPHNGLLHPLAPWSGMRREEHGATAFVAAFLEHAQAWDVA